MRLAIVIPKLTGGGAERVASLMSLHLSRKHNVTLVVIDAEGATYPHGGTLVDLGLRDISVRGFLRRLKNTLLATVKLRKIKKTTGIEVFVSLLELANIPNILSGGGHNIVSVRNARLMVKQNDLQRRAANLLVRMLYNKAEKVVAVSEGVRSSLHEDFGLASSKTLSIPNPLDLDSIRKQAAEGIEDEYREIFTHPVLITAGRLNRQKGQWHLIRAFARVRESVPDAELVILGNGELREYLEGLARDLGINENVHFLDFKINPFKYLSRSAAFVFPSLWEGFPNALAEAMACGLPVLASDCVSGPREILAPETGVDSIARETEQAPHGMLLPVCDGEMKDASTPLTQEESVWGDAMASILTDIPLRQRIAKAARARAEDFAIERVMSKWERLIEECHGA
jgi:glycosyltransferase involved in cell wall biosynthesis